MRPFELAEINQSPEIENNHELKYADDAFPQVEDTDIKRSAKNLDTALCRVSEASTREIENLVDEFHHLDKKLQADLSRIQRDIAEYAELSKGVMQLATTISDGMKRLNVAGIHSIT